MSDAIISIKPQYVSEILSGHKSIELRRRKPNLAVGTKLWIYSTRPEARIVAYTFVGEIHSGTPKEIWNLYSDVAMVERVDFFDYFSGTDKAFGIELQNTRTLAESLPLGKIRKRVKGFHPPQFFSRIGQDSALYSLLFEHESRVAIGAGT